MKNTILSLFALAAVVSSCGSDNNNDSGNNPSNDNYLPLTVDNYWKYEVSSDNAVVGTDSLYIEKDTTINANVYKKFAANYLATELPFGFFTGIMNGNSLRKSGSKLLLTGTTGLSLSAELPVDVDIVDLPVFDSAASTGTEKKKKNDSFSQTISGFPVTVTYNLTATQGETLASYTIPGGESYSNVKSVVLKLNLGVAASIEIFPGVPPTSIPVLQPQDVVVSTVYFANNIGMIYASTNVAYELEDFSSFGITLPIPQTFSQIQTEKLIAHQVE